MLGIIVDQVVDSVEQAGPVMTTRFAAYPLEAHFTYDSMLRWWLSGSAEV